MSRAARVVRASRTARPSADGQGRRVTASARYRSTVHSVSNPSSRRARSTRATQYDGDDDDAATVYDPAGAKRDSMTLSVATPLPMLRIRNPGLATSVAFTIEFVLTPRHELYQPAKPNEQHCYRRGTLRFERVQNVAWTERLSPPATDASGEVDYVNIREFTFEGNEYKLRGLWGAMTFTSLSAPTVVFDS